MTFPPHLNKDMDLPSVWRRTLLEEWVMEMPDDEAILDTFADLRPFLLTIGTFVDFEGHGPSPEWPSPTPENMVVQIGCEAEIVPALFEAAAASRLVALRRTSTGAVDGYSLVFPAEGHDWHAAYDVLRPAYRLLDEAKGDSR